MSEKKKILVFVDWYLPGYKAGGPIRSVANMCGHLKNEYHFRIVTADTDLHETTPYKNIQSDVWTKGPDGTEVLYLSASHRRYNDIQRIITEERADVIYLNSVFSKTFTLYPLMVRKRHFPTRKVVLAPRGMLGAGALNIKPLKKKLFLLNARIMGLYRNIRWHTSSEAETREVQNIFGKQANATVALNLSQPRELKQYTRTKNQGVLRAAFLSRISYKKNLEGTLKILAGLPSSLRVEFDIYGPVEEPEYWKRCEDLIQQMPSHIRVQYKGAIANEKVTETLREYHLSILLTFNENFGHSIVESLAAGCPVLLSDQTPWKNLASQHAGWEFPLSEESSIREALCTIGQMDQTTFDKWSNGALTLAEKIIRNPESIQQHHILFS